MSSESRKKEVFSSVQLQTPVEEPVSPDNKRNQKVIMQFEDILKRIWDWLSNNWVDAIKEEFALQEKGVRRELKFKKSAWWGGI